MRKRERKRGEVRRRGGGEANGGTGRVEQMGEKESERERTHTHPFLRSQWTDSSSHGWSECVVEF